MRPNSGEDLTALCAQWKLWRWELQLLLA